MFNMVPERHPAFDFIIDYFLKTHNLTEEKLDYIKNPKAIHLHDPLLLEGIDTYLEELEALRQSDAKIVIHPDYDADGVTSGMILYYALKLFGFNNVTMYYPKATDGFGINPTAAKHILAMSPEAVLTTDNGTTGFEGIDILKSHGVKVLVSDHHLGEGQNPNADAHVNPNGVLDDSYPFKEICGATVIWKVMYAYAKKYQTDKLYAVRQLIVLAGIGTVCDVMPLIDENRYIIVKSLEIFNHLEVFDRLCIDYYPELTPLVLGLKALRTILEENQKLEGDAQADTYGFYIGPMLNTPRRLLDDPTLAFSVFEQSSYERALDVAEQLYILNEERKREVSSVVDIAESNVELSDPIIVQALDCRPGFAGLIAGRLNNDFGRPTIIFSTQGESGKLIGSARSPEWFHLKHGLDYVYKCHPEYFISYGGHAQAAGISIYSEYLESFKAALKVAVEGVLLEIGLSHPSESPREVAGVPLTLDVFAEGKIDISNVSAQEAVIQAVEYLEQFAPYGHGFRPLTFNFSIDSEDLNAYLMGARQNHIKMLPKGADIELIKWQSGKRYMEYLETNPGPIVFTGTVGMNEYKGKRTFQFLVEQVHSQGKGV